MCYCGVESGTESKSTKQQQGVAGEPAWWSAALSPCTGPRSASQNINSHHVTAIVTAPMYVILYPQYITYSCPPLLQGWPSQQALLHALPLAIPHACAHTNLRTFRTSGILCFRSQLLGPNLPRNIVTSVLTSRKQKSAVVIFVLAC